MVTVIKIGGSLFPNHIQKLCEKLVDSKEDIILVNGGGAFANTIREYNKEIKFSDDVNHWTAIQCMDIIGNLISDSNEHIQATSSLNNIKTLLKTGKIPLILCYELLKKEDPLEHTWDITSDSIACWIANRLNAKLLILTNVDGIYEGNISPNKKKLIHEISAKKLLIFNELPVDKCLPKLLIKYQLDCSIMNGKIPDRVLDHLNNINIINDDYTIIRR